MILRVNEKRTAELQNTEPQNFEGLFRFADYFYKIDRIHSFDIRYSFNKKGGKHNEKKNMSLCHHDHYLCH